MYLSNLAQLRLSVLYIPINSSLSARLQDTKNKMSTISWQIFKRELQKNNICIDLSSILCYQ